ISTKELDPESNIEERRDAEIANERSWEDVDHTEQDLEVEKAL
ncbi:6202_t:CDS:2, partial [Acaulospora colombiana]